MADDGHVTSTVRQWDRRHWGDGGAEFHWWCTESPEAFVGPGRSYKEMAAELTELVGAGTYRRLTAYLRDREARRPGASPSPIRRSGWPARGAPA